MSNWDEGMSPESVMEERAPSLLVGDSTLRETAKIQGQVQGPSIKGGRQAPRLSLRFIKMSNTHDALCRVDIFHKDDIQSPAAGVFDGQAELMMLFMRIVERGCEVLGVTCNVHNIEQLDEKRQKVHDAY